MSVSARLKGAARDNTHRKTFSTITDLRGSSTFMPEFRAMDCEKTTHDIDTKFFYLISTLLKLKFFFFFSVILALTRP